MSEDQLPPDPATLQGSQFLHERNTQFHASTEVEDVANYLRAHGDKIPNSPAHKINAYLGFLANEGTVNDGILTGDQLSIERQVEAAAIELTPENAHAYAKFEANVARQLGQGGDVRLGDMTDRRKMDDLRMVREDQVTQLKEWAEELNGEENEYPDWFKHWTFENVKSHTAHNADPGKDGRPKGFEKRSGSSFALFPELDRESVSLVYDALVEKLGGQKMDFEYNTMRRLLDKAKFSELYEEAQNYGFRITDKLKEVTTGSWHKFDQSNNLQDSQKLSDLVKAYRTGWCTAGSRTAHSQLKNGDFYIWCSTNPDGEDVVPRIAIRMEKGRVAEVRGIVGGRRQELEPELVDTVAEKLKSLPGGEEYFQKAEDMKRITALERKLKADPNADMTSDEVRFLYEIGHEIKGFGYSRDPRIDELRAKRGERDIAEIVKLMPEFIRGQLQHSYKAYEAVMTSFAANASKQEGPTNRLSEAELKQRIDEALQRLGLDVPVVDASKPTEMLSEKQLEELFVQKDQEWRKNGLYDYLAEQHVKHGVKHLLVITPNIAVDGRGIIKLSKSFWSRYAEPFDYKYNRVAPDDYKQYFFDEGGYSPRQLSGVKGDGKVTMCLIPSEPNENTAHKTVAEQLEILRDMQTQKPDLNFKVPSILEAVSYWYSLKENGRFTASYQEGKIVHIDLPPKNITKGAYGDDEDLMKVPQSYTIGNRPFIRTSSLRSGEPVRIAVG